jgi:peroxiredoxin (alkyl hydroperoxide reductase subunit C)
MGSTSVIVPTAGSCGVAKERMENKTDMTCHDWFFCTKKIDKDTVIKKITHKK